MNFQEFADTRGLTLESVMVPFRPDDDWDKTTTHYAVRIRQHGHGPVRTIWQGFYSMGSAHKTGPKIADVLQSLAGDAYATCAPFEEWAGGIRLRHGQPPGRSHISAVPRRGGAAPGRPARRLQHPLWECEE